jgi:hypothetical protein
MFCARSLKIFALAVFFAATYSFASDWRFNAGLGIRNQTPVVAIAGFGYKDAILRVQGMGFYKEEHEFWCGIRGSLLWTFFRELPFNFDAGIGGGYEYARAPNKIQQALNKANEGVYMLGHNYKEIADISIELWTHLYGFYTQISVPAIWIQEYDAPKIMWSTGYIYEF